jgi:hypothetical protein
MKRIVNYKVLGLVKLYKREHKTPPWGPATWSSVGWLCHVPALVRAPWPMATPPRPLVAPGPALPSASASGRRASGRRAACLGHWGRRPMSPWPSMSARGYPASGCRARWHRPQATTPLTRSCVRWEESAVRRRQEERIMKEGTIGSEEDTTWKTGFGNRRRSPFVTGNAPVTDQVLQISQER